jgi:hypothetical protein
MRCHKCKGELEPICRDGEPIIKFCRTCKLPYNLTGGLAIDLSSLNSSYQPVKTARGIIGKAHPGATPVTKSALEVLMIQGFQDIYMAGLKDGILLAYSQDVRPGGPIETQPRTPSTSGKGTGQ